MFNYINESEVSGVGVIAAWGRTLNQRKTILIVVAPVVVLAGAGALWALSDWLGYDPAKGLTRSLPGMDGGPPESERNQADELNVDLAGELATYDLSLIHI